MITKLEKKVLENAYLHLKVRRIRYDNGVAKCYDEKKEFLFEATYGSLFEIAKKLPPGKEIVISQLINEDSEG